MKPRVLVASDLDSIHRLVNKALPAADYDVLSAYTREALIELADWAEPDLVVVAFLDEPASLDALAVLKATPLPQQPALAWIRSHARQQAPADVAPPAHLTFPVVPTHRTLAACVQNLLNRRVPWMVTQSSFEPTQTLDI